MAAAQQATTFGSASGVTCPPGNVICNGSVNFLTTELFFEPETPFSSLKETALTWNELEYLFDNPYVPTTGVACQDGSGPQPPNDQGFPTYCTPTGDTFGTNVRRPAFGVSHVVRASQAGAGTVIPGLPPFRVHPLNYNAPNGTEQRVLNPGYAGGSFDNTNVCYTLGASCTPAPSNIDVTAGISRLDPAQAPEIDYNVAVGRKLDFCQNNPEPVPLDAPFNTAFDSETLTACGADPGEPGAASLAHDNTNPLLCGTQLLGAGSQAGPLCEDNLGLPFAGQQTASWYSTPAVPAGSATIALLRQIPAGSIAGLTTGTALPIQPAERLVDPGLRGVIQRYDPITGTGGLKKPSLAVATSDGAVVGGTGVAPAYLYNSTANLDERGQDQLLPSNENDYVGLYTTPTGNAYQGVTAGNYYPRKQAARLEAARLGKSLFWDMQVGSDAVQSCGSCHAHAGADNRTKNQVNPNGQDGIPGNPTNFTANAFTFPPNHDLTVADYPFHKLKDPEIAGDPVCSPAITGNVAGITFPDGDPPDHPRSTYTACDAANIVRDTDDVASSMGVHFGKFFDIPPIGAASFGRDSRGVRALVRDLRSPIPADNVDPIPGFAGSPNADGSANQFRRVEPRNTPTIFLADANFDNFWDGRARHDDNGGSVFGITDPQAHIFIDDPTSATGGLTATRQLIKFSSLASLAKGPGLSKFEMSFDGRNWAKIAKKLLQRGVTPLANQLVDPTDSFLGPYSNQNGSDCATLPAADRSPEGGPATPLGTGVPGLCITYAALIRHAFNPALHRNTTGHFTGCYTDERPDIHPNQCGTGARPAAAVTVLDPDGVVRSHNNDPFDTYVLAPATGPANATDTNQFTHMEGNFGLFWGQSIHLWASLLVPDDTPFDRFQDQNPDAAMVMGETGEPLLVLDMPNCNNLPAGYTRDSLHPGCFREVGNFKRNQFFAADISHAQNDTVGHPRMSACVNEVTIAGTRTCTERVPAGGTRQPTDPDPLLGMDIFFGSNVSLRNPNFRSARCGACHNAPNLTDNTTMFTHKTQLVDAAAEFERGNPVVEPLMEPLGKMRIISGFHLESEINGPGQDAIERKISNESIVPAPVVNNNGNCTTANCSGYSFPDAITVNANANGYVIHADLGTGPVAGNGVPVPFTSFGGSFFDNGVYNIGVRPCVADQAKVTGACEDTGRGATDAFGWPLSHAALLMKNLGGPGQEPGVPLPTFDPSFDEACAPFCATGGLFEDTGHDQQINPGQGDEQLNYLLPPYMATFANRITVGDAHPALDEACGPVGGCINTLTDVANAEGFPEFPFDPRANLSEVINSAVAAGDSTIGGRGGAFQGTWPFVNRVSRFGSFKAPQLREVELTGPYFHNGGMLTLRQVVDFYVRGGDFPVTNSRHRDFNILNLNAELQSDLSEEEKVALVDFLLELTDDRVALEKAPFDHPQVILPLDGRAPESDGVVNRDAMLTGCVPASQFGPGQQACDGGMFLNVPAVGSAGNATRLPNFLGIAGRNATNTGPALRLSGAAAFCGEHITSQYCH
ncbi:Methylamine utilization protein mauG [Minicystis rosea]|nr:Methylamine utilization protein mauG [Minicystis rosea]